MGRKGAYKGKTSWGHSGTLWWAPVSPMGFCKTSPGFPWAEKHLILPEQQVAQVREAGRKGISAPPGVCFPPSYEFLSSGLSFLVFKLGTEAGPRHTTIRRQRGPPGARSSAHVVALLEARVGWLSVQQEKGYH